MRDPPGAADPPPAADPPRADEAVLAIAIERMRFALAVDDDLRPFWDAFRDDPLVGPSLRARPHLRITRRPDPFEALVWAICEQLIEYQRAVAIERRIVQRLGRRCAESGLRDLPDAATPGRDGAGAAAVLRPQRGPGAGR